MLPAATAPLRGACTGEESTASTDLRLRMALAAHVVPRWPVEGIALVSECGATVNGWTSTSCATGAGWATARDDAELASLLESPPAAIFDIDIARLLHKRWAKGTYPFAQRRDCNRLRGAHASGAVARRLTELIDD